MAENNQKIRFQVEWLWALFPTFLGLGLVVLFSEMDLIEFNFSVHDLDTFILLLGLLATISMSSVIISREAIRGMARITERRLRLEFAEERARFLSQLNHEIKNPIMGIKIALDNLAETPESEKRHQIRSSISTQIDRLSRIVTDLRKLAELDKHQIERSEVDIHMVAEDAFSLAQENPDAPDRQMRLELQVNLPHISGDYDLLLLAVHNVLNNAIKYSRPGDQVSLNVAVRDNDIQIAVRDTGMGIAEDELPNVWDELFRSDSVKDIPGSGIGLALVRRIIERHGGQTTIHSALNHGTTVCLHLPVTVQNN